MRFEIDCDLHIVTFSVTLYSRFVSIRGISGDPRSMSFRTMAATSVCSDGRSHCRLKVRITTNIDSIDIPKVIWSSVAFEIQPNVRDFCQKLCTNLGLGGRQAEIYMIDVLIPNWEVCSFIFKDGDELEYVRKCFKSVFAFSCVCGYKDNLVTSLQAEGL